MKKFQPIGLCNTIYKVITKIIANLIKSFLEKLIGPQQTSFLKGRWASDNAILIQEIVRHLCHNKSSKRSLILKIDIEKAFDHLEWSFVYQTLLFFKFPPKITNLIMSCITTSRIAILVNSTKTDYFSPSRGIRQGGPISPYIFILCMELLS